MQANNSLAVPNGYTLITDKWDINKTNREEISTTVDSRSATKDGPKSKMAFIQGTKALSCNTFNGKVCFVANLSSNQGTGEFASIGIAQEYANTKDHRAFRHHTYHLEPYTGIFWYLSDAV